MTRRIKVAAVVFLAACHTRAPTPDRAGDIAPLVVGETTTIVSRALGETRRINIFIPPGYADSATMRLPVLYMPDGGLQEDFQHIAGLVHIGVLNGTMRPFLLVGIENTERRRDLTGPTANAKDSTIAKHVGGSAAFRSFIRTELMPWVKAHYRTTNETAIVGESLAGLFIVETFLLEPDLFDTYIAFDPSLWWNDAKMLNQVGSLMRSHPPEHKTLYLAHSSQPDIAAETEQLAKDLTAGHYTNLDLHYEPMPGETHGTIYHPAALRAFRAVFAPRDHR